MNGLAGFGAELLPAHCRGEKSAVNYAFHCEALPAFQDLLEVFIVFEPCGHACQDVLAAAQPPVVTETDCMEVTGLSHNPPIRPV
ncbi:MAG: hypothetical protein A4E57_01616 [Syntrophorhabdaceae bacterium PtaU1.Bin034]|nr:MAG: hypothetical protein A4E57_01616 [Syntrophorhabdaceae bacterium PtaU1.Bin034]